jgi:flagellar hook-length control protein FliK
MHIPVMSQPDHYFEKMSTRPDSEPQLLREKKSDVHKPFSLPLSKDNPDENVKTNSIKSVQKQERDVESPVQTDQKKDETPLPDNSQLNPIAQSAAPASPEPNSTPQQVTDSGDGTGIDLNKSAMGKNLLLEGDLSPQSREANRAQNASVRGTEMNSVNEKNSKALVANQVSNPLFSLYTKNSGSQSEDKLSVAGPSIHQESAVSSEIHNSDLVINPISEGKKSIGEKSAGNESKKENGSDSNQTPGFVSSIMSDQSHEGTPVQNFSLNHQVGGEADKAVMTMQDLPPGEKEVLQQLTGWLSSHRREEIQTIRLKLTPESLGTIQIDLTVQNQQVKADIVASTQQVKELLEKHQDLLRNGLADNGMKIELLTVRLEEKAGFQAGGTMDFYKGFSHRENSPSYSSWHQNGLPVSIAATVTPQEGTRIVSK